MVKGRSGEEKEVWLRVSLPQVIMGQSIMLRVEGQLLVCQCRKA